MTGSSYFCVCQLLFARMQASKFGFTKVQIHQTREGSRWDLLTCLGKCWKSDGKSDRLSSRLLSLTDGVRIQEIWCCCTEWWSKVWGDSKDLPFNLWFWRVILHWKRYLLLSTKSDVIVVILLLKIRYFPLLEFCWVSSGSPWLTLVSKVFADSQMNPGMGTLIG